MAKEKRTVGVEKFSEAKLAGRVIERYNLSVPIDIETLIKRHADLIYEDIPIPGVDGVCLNLKSKAKKTKVIVNSGIPLKRQKFTMAHELGHILIPWHIGNIVDNLDNVFSQFAKDYHYWEMEGQANRFAAELLMPRDWINKILDSGDLATVHKKIAMECGVSDQAAAIRLSDVLHPDVIFCCESSGKVKYTGCSAGTVAFEQKIGALYDPYFYPFVEEHSINETINGNINWWKLKADIDIPSQSNQSWRELLDEICDDIYKPAEIKGRKFSINGIVAAANGSAKRLDGYNLGKVKADIFHRIRRPEFESFYKHKLFHDFLNKRSEDFFSK